MRQTCVRAYTDASDILTKRAASTLFSPFNSLFVGSHHNLLRAREPVMTLAQLLVRVPSRARAAVFLISLCVYH